MMKIFSWSKAKSTEQWPKIISPVMILNNIQQTNNQYLDTHVPIVNAWRNYPCLSMRFFSWGVIWLMTSKSGCINTKEMVTTAADYLSTDISAYINKLLFWLQIFLFTQAWQRTLRYIGYSKLRSMFIQHHMFPGAWADTMLFAMYKGQCVWTLYDFVFLSRNGLTAISQKDHFVQCI